MSSVSTEFLDDGWPALDALIGDRAADLKGDVQFLLDFAIIAFPKTATTFTMKWLAGHEEILMNTQEVYSLQLGKPAELVSQFYDMPRGMQYKRGYKAPGDIDSIKALQALDHYWPNTKLMVGVRHPVLWFESFYNFRIRHNITLPPPEQLIGSCTLEMHGVCTDGSRFHNQLDNLGKTPRSDPFEKKLLGSQRRDAHQVPRMRNEVFLYEISQLVDANQTRATQYRTDLKDYLGLRNDLMPVVSPNTSKPKMKAMNICDAKYQLLRAELMQNAVEASTWISSFLLHSPGVYVSSPDYFNELLESWMEDPCVDRERRGASPASII
jgi:hypothetical protein